MPVAVDHRRAPAGRAAPGDDHDGERPLVGRGTGDGWPPATAPRRVVRRPRRRTRSALDVLVVGLVAYGGAAVLNARHLHRQAEHLPLDSTGRGALVATAGAVERAVAIVGLDRPGSAIDGARHLVDPAGAVAAAGALRAERLDDDRLARRLDYERQVTAAAARVAARRAADAAAARATAARLAAAQPAFSDPHWRRLPGDDLIAARPARSVVPDSADQSGAPGSAASATAAVASSSTTTPPGTTAGTTAGPSGAEPPPAARQLRTPTATDPWRVYVGGDSLAQGIGPALGRIGTDNGLMAVAAHGVLSSGLARPDAYDWPDALAGAARSDSEIVVLVFGANDPQAMSAGGESIAFGTPAWEAEYARRVSEVLDELTGKTVLWVGLPVVGRPDLERQLQVLDRIYREQVATHPNAMYLDTRAITSTDGVSYQPYLDGGDGQEFLARTNDKVHFTARGYDLVAQAVALRLLQLTGP